MSQFIKEGGLRVYHEQDKDNDNAWPIESDYTVLLDFMIQTCNCAKLIEEIFLWNSEFSKQGEETVNELLFWHAILINVLKYIHEILIWELPIAVYEVCVTSWESVLSAVLIFDISKGRCNTWEQGI